MKVLRALLLFLMWIGVSHAAEDPGPRPPPAAQELASLIGEYGTDEQSALRVYERDGRLFIHFGTGDEPLVRVSRNVYANGRAARLRFARTRGGAAQRVSLDGKVFERHDFGAEVEAAIRKTVRHLPDLRARALAATPPLETGKRPADLVEIAPLDPGIHLDIRYATEDNFMGIRLYDEPRAFLQRPAAEAVVRAHHALAQYGYGILIKDAYRPWYVTKMFWDATPDSAHDYVADPSQGSRHNRGCAVDLTLYDLATGAEVQMPGRYDEISIRSSPDYVGGTSLERWRRDLLRSVMEAQGFSVYPHEWWHFDYAGWEQYPILNLEFDRVGG